MLTNERAELIAKYLTADADRANKLLDLPVEEAVAQMNADGNDFTAEEVKEFGVQLQAAAAQQGGVDGELDADALDNVAGGVVISGAVLTAGVTLFLGGVTAGYKVARDRGW